MKTKLFTVDQAAAEIGVRPRQIRHWIDRGDLKFIPSGRRIYIDMMDFEDMIARLKTRKCKEEDGDEEIELE